MNITAETILQAAAISKPQSIAGAITSQVKKFGKSQVRAIGESAVNQAVKALSISRGQLLQVGIDPIFYTTFADITVNDEKRTAILFTVEPR